MSPLPILNTHIMANSETTIDVILCKNSVIPSLYGKLTVPDLSAHQLLYMFYPIEVPIKVSQFVNIRDYNISSEELINDALTGKWTNMIPYININFKVDVLNQELLSIWNKHAPPKTIRTNNVKSRWITKEIIGYISQRNSARRIWSQTKSTSNWNKYVALKKNVKQMTKFSMRRHLHTFIGAGCNSMRALWGKLRHFGLVKDRNCNRQLAVDLYVLLDAFTCEKVPTSPLICASCLNYRNNVLLFGEKFYFKDVTTLDICQAIKSIKSTAVGDDQIQSK
jgi:hypothetical protein